MKKVLAFLLICALIPAFALAEATPAEPEKKTVSGVLAALGELDDRLGAVSEPNRLEGLVPLATGTPVALLTVLL